MTALLIASLLVGLAFGYRIAFDRGRRSKPDPIALLFDPSAITLRMGDGKLARLPNPDGVTERYLQEYRMERPAPFDHLFTGVTS